MPYKHKEVELTMEWLDTFNLPTPPKKFKASPLYRGHKWDTTTIGYELFRRVQYYGSLPTERLLDFKHTQRFEWSREVKERVSNECGPEVAEALYLLYSALEYRVKSYNRTNPTFMDQRETYFEDMRKLYNRHGDLYRKSDPRRKSNQRLEYNESRMGQTNDGTNLNAAINSLLHGKEADRRNEAIITYDKSMPGNVPGAGMAKHYYRKYNDGIITISDIPNKYIEQITNLIEIGYEVV